MFETLTLPQLYQAIHSLEHGWFMDEESVDRMIAGGIWWVPTLALVPLSIDRTWAELDHQLRQDFTVEERRELLAQMKELEGGESFGAGRTPGGPSRWVGMTGRDNSFVSVSPVLVCEVTYDHLQSGRFRHAARLLRWRPDKPPEECRFDQILPRGRRR